MNETIKETIVPTISIQPCSPPTSCFTSPEQEASNTHILSDFRKKREGRHRIFIKKTWRTHPLSITIPFSNTYPFITFDQVQDLANKSFAFYLPNSLTLGKDTAEWLSWYFYDKWTRGNVHARDIEFRKFLTKYIGVVKDAETLDTTGVAKMHGKLLKMFTVCERYCGSKTVEKWDGELVFDKKQWKHYAIKPLFRALIIVFDSYTDEQLVDERSLVSLVKTGVEEGLSGPISFRELGVEGEEDVVRVSLEEAVGFMVKLEEREERALVLGGKVSGRRGVLHEGIGGMKELGERGYTGGPPGPSEEWIEEEDDGEAGGDESGSGSGSGSERIADSRKVQVEKSNVLKSVKRVENL